MSRDFDRLRSEMEELFSDLWQARRLAGPRRCFHPAVDVFRTESPPAVVVVCELAGVDPADVRVEVDDGVLSIAGSRRRPAGAGTAYQQIEIDHGPFERHVVVGPDVDSDAAEAQFEHGLLTVRLPLVREESRPARVSIAVRRRP